MENKTFETYLVKLWVENEESFYNQCTEIFNAAKSSGKEEKEAIVELAEAIKTGLEDNNPIYENMRPENLIYMDLLSSAISNIDFFEVAKTFAE